MHLMLTFLLGLFVQQTLQQQQRGNFFSGTPHQAPQARGGFSNIGNVNRHSLAAAGGNGNGYPAPHSGGGGGGYPGGGGGRGFQTGFGGLAPSSGRSGGSGGVGAGAFFGGGGLGTGLGFGGKLGFGGIPGFGHLGIGGHGLLPFKGQGGHGQAYKAVEPLKLTCKNVEVQPASPGYGARVSALAATISRVRTGNSFGSPFGAPFLFGGHNQHGAGQRGLSLDLSVKVEGGHGQAKVVFTERAAVDAGGCNKYSLGGIFTGDDNRLFGNLFGPGFLGGYGGGNDGVVTTLTVYPDRPTTVHKDRLDIDQIETLAGRGIAVVSSVTANAYGRYEMSDEILACCSLAYDDKHRDLTDLHGGAGAGYPGHPGPHHPPHAAQAPYRPLDAPPPPPTHTVDPAPYTRDEDPYERPHDRTVTIPSGRKSRGPVPGPVVGPQRLPGGGKSGLSGRPSGKGYDDPRFDGSVRH